MRQRKANVFAIALAILVSACGAPGATGGGAGTPTTLAIGIQEGAPSLDPLSSTTSAWQSLTASTIEQLVYFDADKPTINPGLATSWSNVDDKTLELKLRQGVKFTNGEEFDSTAATYSLERLLKAKPYSSWTTNIASVKAVDKYTIRVVAKQPSGMILPALARGSYMYPPKYAAEQGDKFGSAPIGTGPYKFVSYDKSSQLVLEANPDYWGGKPRYAKIVFQIIPEEAARVAALKAGEVQLITNLSASSNAEVSATSNLHMVKRQGLRQFASFFDELMDSPVKSKLVRQALNYAVDKAALVKLYGGEATALQGQWLTSGVPGFNSGIKAYPYDPKKARDLLAEAGYPNGFETTLTYTIDRYPLDKEMGQAVAGYLDAVGVKVTQQPLQYAKFQPTFHAGIGKLGPIFQWGLLTPPDPEMTLGIFGPKSDYRRFPDGGKVDELTTAAAKETDQSKRAKLYEQLIAYWYDDPFAIYLIVPNDLYAATKTLEGFVARQDQVVMFDVKFGK